jgi:hypothetical protein
MDAGNWITLLLGMGTLTLGAATTYAQWPRRIGSGKRSSSRPAVLIACLSAVVVGAVAYDIYDRRHRTHLESVLSWGGVGDKYHMIVSTHDLQGLAKTQRMMLIMRPVLLGADPMTDTNIAKSGLFTIAGPAITLAVPSNTPLRMVPNQPNLIDYNAVLLPIGVGPERIRTLADVVDLGGAVYATRATSVMAGPAIDTANPSPPAK